MARKDIHKDGKATQFGSGQDPTRGGRKKKIYTILKEKGYSKEDVHACFGELAFYTLAELREVAKDETKPVIMVVLAMAFKNAAQKGDYRQIKEIMEQSIGRPNQAIDVTTGGEKVNQRTDLSNLSAKELIALRQINKKIKVNDDNE
jgi:hypothetical protein